MDIDVLISCVLMRPAIWDKRDKSHSNRSLVDRCWKEIAREMEIDESALRKKWKYLREQFCVELGKIHQPSFAGEECAYTESTKWPHFKSLLFLKDVVKPRIGPASSNNLVMTVPVDPANFAEDAEDSLDDQRNAIILEEPCPEQKENLVLGSLDPTVITSPISSLPEIPSVLIPNHTKRCYQNDNNTIVEFERKRLKLLKLKSKSQKPMEDEDMLFFRSLLPHLHHVEQSQKLKLRSKILDVVSDFVYPQPLSAPSSHTYSSQSEDFNYKRPTPNLSPRTDSD